MKSSCKIFVVMSVLMGFALCSSFAQKGKSAKSVDSTIVSQGSLPVEVTKSFKKRFASATDVVWRLIDGNFVVECVVRSVPTEATFQTDGIWLSTTEELDPNSLPSPAMKSVNSYFPKCTLNSYKRKTDNNKEITFIVGVYESQNIKKKLETIVWLDKTGAVIQTIEPEEPAETVAAASSDEESTSSKKTAKQESKTKKEKDGNMDGNPIKISENELPYDLLRWISLRYSDYNYKEVLYMEDPDFEDEGNLYRIKMQRSGVGQSAHTTIWFTRDGEFLKVDDSHRTVDELQKVAEEAMAAERARIDKDDDKTTPKGRANVKPKEDAPLLIAVDEEEVPPEYIAAFKWKYPKVKERTWNEDAEGNFRAFYTDQAGKNEVFFEKTDSVRWLETKIPIADLAKVPFSMRSAVEKDYPKQVVINRAWNVKSAVEKPYTIIELYNRRDYSTETLEFWQTGKLKRKIVSEQAKEQEKVEVNTKEVKTSKSKDKATAKEEETPQVVEVLNAPEEYMAALKLKYPRVKDVTWGKDEFGDWVAFYTDQAGKNEVFFEKTDSVKWLETKTPIADLNKVPFSIRSAVERDYPKQVSIKRAWNVKSAVVKPYIIVELYNKKDKSTTTLEFWQTGKPK